MKAKEFLTAIAKIYEVDNGIGYLKTYEDYEKDIRTMFPCTIFGKIESNSIYLYFYEYNSEDILRLTCDVVIVNRDDDREERIYLSKINLNQ